MSDTEDNSLTTVKHLLELRKKSIEKYLNGDDNHDNNQRTILLRCNYIPAKDVVQVDTSKSLKKGYALRKQTRKNYSEVKRCSTKNRTILDRRDYLPLKHSNWFATVKQFYRSLKRLECIH